MPTQKLRTLTACIAGLAAATALCTAVGPADAAPSTHKGKVQVSHARPDPKLLASERAAGKGVVSTADSRAALVTVQSQIAGYVAQHGTRYTFGSYADPTTGQIVLDTNAPKNVVAKLTQAPATTSSEGRAAFTTLRVHRTTTTDAYQRRDDVPSFYGGGGLLASGALCSAGYAVQNAAGTRFMVTAGHCYANGTSVRTESDARVVGTVQSRALASLGSGSVDMELLAGQGYWGRIFTGGVVSATSAPVVSAGNAVVGYTAYCHSGRTTGEQCGHTATSTTAQVCTSTGCKSPVIAYTGGTVQQGGDSGGTFYAKDGSGNIYIRGHVLAGNSTTGYIEPWAQVASRYGVSIVTG